MSNLVNNGVTPMINVGGVSLPLSMAILFNAYSQASRYTTLKKNGVSYQVPNGYKLVLVAFISIAHAAASINSRVGYGDDAVDDSIAAPTNNVAINPIGYNPTSASIGSSASFFTHVEIPAGKYPYVQNMGGESSCNCIGYLVAV